MSRVSVYSDVGLRDNMEDALVAFAIGGGRSLRQHAPVLGVLDGAGGPAAGEVASDVGRSALIKHLAAELAMMDLDSAPPRVLMKLAKTALRRSNQAVLARRASKPALREMASTAVVAVIVRNRLYVAHVGDSRCYLHQQGILRQLTRDHSVVTDLIAAGKLAPEDTEFHPGAHTITRYLGQAHDFRPEGHMYRIGEGDIVLLCTDGLTGALSDNEIVRHIEAYRAGEIEFGALPKALVEHSITCGSTDNVTVVCCHYGLAHTTGSFRGRTRTGGYATAMVRAVGSFPGGQL